MGGSVVLGILGFNPTLVRLRLGGSTTIPSASKKFQSHAGSIEATDGRIRRLGDPGFQSHAGSIEAQRGLAGEPSGVLFQSHAGSIEAEEASAVG